MKFYSTNKKAPPAAFEEALLRGLAPDGGLYMPEKLPKSHPENQPIEKTLSLFVDIPTRKLRKICNDAFSFPVPIKKITDDLFILELFHGPTLSFKDFGARFMARMMNYYLGRSKKRLTIITATSGDTGSAVANGFYGLRNIRVFVLYPYRRISNLQEQQIATFGKNIIAIAVRGDFDDCQRLAKKVLSDKKLRASLPLSSANSINVGRLIPQMSYYIFGYRKFARFSKNKKPIFVVPSGNFGNLTAGLFVKEIGLPIRSFIAAVNKNSAVPAYLKTGKLPVRKAVMTLSNAMDVGVPSNFARIIELYKNNRVKMRNDIKIITIFEKETESTIKNIFRKYGYLADPHTAVGIAAALKSKNKHPKIILATAHPAKFKDSVEKIIGQKIAIPRNLVRVLKKPKRNLLIRNNYQELKKILERTK